MKISVTKRFWPDTCHERWMDEEFNLGLVSVVMPTYNRANIVTEAMDSIWNQKYRPIELLLVDDGSTDNTKSVVEQWCRNHNNDPMFYLRAFFCKINNGAPVARNLGLIKSRGEFIQFLDSDDLIGPDKLVDAIKVMCDKSEVDLVYSLREDIEVLTGQRNMSKNPLANLEKYPFVTEVALWPIWTALPVFRRSSVLYAGPWNEELTCHQDSEFIARVVLCARKCCQINKVQAFYRHHVGIRISKKPWGDVDGVVSYLKTTRSFYEMIKAAGGAKKYLALAVLAGRCLSCVRVAIAIGQPKLARLMIIENRDILKHMRFGLLKAQFWQYVSFIPEKATRPILKLIVQIKNRHMQKEI